MSAPMILMKCHTAPPPPRRGRWHGEALTEGVSIGRSQSATYPTPRLSGGTLPCERRDGPQHEAPWADFREIGP